MMNCSISGPGDLKAFKLFSPFIMSFVFINICSTSLAHLFEPNRSSNYLKNTIFILIIAN